MVVRISCRNPTLSLEKWQIAVANHLRGKPDKSVLLNGGTGTGKTLNAIHIGEDVYQNDDGHGDPIMTIVALTPASLISNFEKGIRLCHGIDPEDPLPEHYQIFGYSLFQRRQGDMVRRRNTDRYSFDPDQDGPFMLILDEAHMLKKLDFSRAPKTGNLKTTALVYNLARKAKYVVLLTATPFVGSPSDISVLMRMITPKEQHHQFPLTSEEFLQMYDVRADDEEVALDAITRYRDAIRGKIAVYMGKKKEHKKKLPKVKHHNFKVKMSKRQRKALKIVQDKSFRNPERLEKLLKQMQRSGNLEKQSSLDDHDHDHDQEDDDVDDDEEVEEEEVLDFDDQGNLVFVKRKKAKKGKKRGKRRPREAGANLNSFLTTGRQISNTATPGKGDSKNSGKIPTLVETAMEGPKPVMIYSEFLAHGLDAVRDQLLRKGVPKEKIAMFTGKITKDQKDEILDNYNDLDGYRTIDYLLFSKAGQVGLSTKGTRQLHMLETFWSDAEREQVIGRAIRLDSFPREYFPRKRDRRVDVYQWNSYIGKKKRRKHKLTEPDKVLWKIAQKKQEIIGAFQYLNKKTSIDVDHIPGFEPPDDEKPEEFDQDFEDFDELEVDDDEFEVDDDEFKDDEEFEDEFEDDFEVEDDDEQMLRDLLQKTIDFTQTQIPTDEFDDDDDDNTIQSLKSKSICANQYPNCKQPTCFRVNPFQYDKQTKDGSWISVNVSGHCRKRRGA